MGIRSPPDGAANYLCRLGHGDIVAHHPPSSNATWMARRLFRPR